MTLPLYRCAAAPPLGRGNHGHAGLWYDKFCHEWHVDNTWSLKDRKSTWIETLTNEAIGSALQIEESALRLATLVDARGGRWGVFTTASRFVTGLGRSHPLENGFAWHPTLGTSYLPGSSVKGLVRAWARLDAYPKPACETLSRLLGDVGTVGRICFFDAIPTAPVHLEADIMTPHFADWTPDDPPGDWRSPTPIPFLTTAAGTPFLFAIAPGRNGVSDGDLQMVEGWLSSALDWNGAGAKTAVGYGRFARDTVTTGDLRRRLCAREQARQERIQAEREADERAIRMARMTRTEREIEEILDSRQDKNTPAVAVIMQHVRNGRWKEDAKVEAAMWLRNMIQQEDRWKETSGARNPAKDRKYQNTLQVKCWLRGD